MAPAPNASSAGSNLPPPSVLASPPPSFYRRPTFAAATATTAAPQWPNQPPTATATATEPDPTTDQVVAETTGRPAPWAATLEPERVLEIAGWFVLAGAALSTLGFLLPWSRIVIGAGDYGGYLSTWGLASPTHLFVFLAILGVLTLAVVPTPVPAWIGAGIAGLTLGALLIGLSWPYMVGPLGADLGVRVVGLGGLSLIVGGVLASWSSRHVETGPPV